MTNWRTQAFDPATKRIDHGSLVIDDATGTITIRLPYLLESPNKTLWQNRWVKKADRDAWMTRLRHVMCQAAGLTTLSAFHALPAAALGLPRVTERRRVIFERWVPSKRHHALDGRNRDFAPKHLEDCLTKLGFWVDDNDTWLEKPPVTQPGVSPDGRPWTVVRIEIPTGCTVPLRIGAAVQPRLTPFTNPSSTKASA